MSVSEDFRVICTALGGIFSELLNIIISLYIKSGLFCLKVVDCKTSKDHWI